jgi:hypothetical protein
MTTPTASRWTLRDWTAAAALFAATAAFVLWQNSRLAVLWDISYLLDTSWRIALGQHPYRDFPLVHAPLTFLLQAAVIRLTGRVFFHHVLYAAFAGALATVLTWRIALAILCQHETARHLDRSKAVLSPRGVERPLYFVWAAGSPWLLSLLLAAPLPVLGIYSIFPVPFYDCDCILAVLIALYALQRLPAGKSPPLRGVLTGVALVVPLFFKQNIGLPFLLSAVAAILILLAAQPLARTNPSATPTPATLLAVLAGAAAALLTAALLLHLTAGLHNYLYWTIHFAAQQRLPGLHDMLGIFVDPALLWQLPCAAIAVFLLARTRTLWLRWLAVALLAAPFLWTLALLALHTDASDHADDLLALWPLLLILAAANALLALGLAIYRRTLSLATLLPLLLLATIFGTMLSQQLWGSTYAIWPLLVLLVAGLLAALTGLPHAPAAQPFWLPALTATFAATLLLCGGLYAASAERLSYAQLQDGPLAHSAAPALRGMATRGPYLPDFDQLLRFAAAEIPPTDALLLLPGEDPFYFATGRTPRFPVLLFDSTCDPYSPGELAALARERNVRWLILERNLQLTADPTPQRDATLQILAPQFTLYRALDNYDVYRRRD